MKNKLLVFILVAGIHNLYSMDSKKGEKKVSFAELGMRQVALESDTDSDHENLALLQGEKLDKDSDEDYGLFCDVDQDDNYDLDSELITGFANSVKVSAKSPDSTAFQISPSVGHRSPSVCTVGASAKADIFDSSSADTHVTMKLPQGLKGPQLVTVTSAEWISDDSDDSNHCDNTLHAAPTKKSLSTEEIAAILFQQSAGKDDHILAACASKQSEKTIADMSEQRRPFSSGAGAGSIATKKDVSSKKRSFQSAENINPQHIVHHRSVPVSSRSSFAFASMQAEGATVSKEHEKQQDRVEAVAGLLSYNSVSKSESKKRSFEAAEDQQEVVEKADQSLKRKFDASDDIRSVRKNRRDHIDHHSDDSDDDL